MFQQLNRLLDVISRTKSKSMIDRVKLGKDYAKAVRKEQRARYNAWLLSCAYRSVEDELAEAFLKKGVKIISKTTIPDTFYVILDGDVAYLVTGKTRSQLLRIAKKTSLQEYFELENL